MPRRNRSERRRPFRPTENTTPTPSYEALAHQLVAAGKCSPLILDRPHLSQKVTTP